MSYLTKQTGKNIFIRFYAAATTLFREKNDIQHTAVTLPVQRRKLLLICILLLGFALRVSHISGPYTDIAAWRQCSVAMMAQNFYENNTSILYPQINWSGRGPGYNGREFQTVSYIASILYRIVGQRDSVGRLVTLCFGIWGIFALYRLVKLVWNENQALAAATIMAVMPIAVFVERAFLPDPAMVSMVTTGLWMFMTYLQTEKRKYLVLAALALCLGFLTKITGMLTGLAIIYALVIYVRNKPVFNLRNIIPFVIVGALILCIVGAYYLWAHHLSVSYPPYHFAGEGNWVWNHGLMTWIQQGYFVHILFYIIHSWMWGWPILILFGIGLIHSFMPLNEKDRPLFVHSKYKLFFHYWVIGFVFFYCIGAKELLDNFWNFHIVSPAIAAFSGRALILIGTRFSRGVSVIAFSIALLLSFIIYLNIGTLRNLYHPYYGSDYRMGKAINNLKNKNDLVITIGEQIGSPVAIFYSRTKGWVFPPAGDIDWDNLPENDTTGINYLKDLQQQGAAWFGINSTHLKTIRQQLPVFFEYLSKHSTLKKETEEFSIFQLQKLN